MDTKHKVLDTIKSVSGKPLLVTARDGLIVMIVTLVVTLICVWLYYKLTLAIAASSVTEPDWKTLIVRTSATAFALAFVYEYTGINNMLSESSMRYAKGTTLEKYTTRRSALLHECLYKISNNQSGLPPNVNIADINHNAKLLEWIITHTSSRGKLSDAARSGNKDKVLLVAEKITMTNPKSSVIVNEISNMDISIIKNIDTLGDRLNEDIIYYTLINGLTDLSLIDIEQRGSEIKNKFNQEPDSD